MDGFSRISALEKIGSPLPLRHWLSFKTHPVKSLLSTWRSFGLGVEVVSEFEFAAALRVGFQPNQILVNGPLKHTWLPRYAERGIRVHFDSVRECQELTPIARDLDWQIGLRFHLRNCFDPDNPEQDAQFGLTGTEGRDAIAIIRRAGVKITSIHFHLRSHLRETTPSCLTRRGISPHFSQSLIFSPSGVGGFGVVVFSGAGIGFGEFLSTWVSLFCSVGSILGKAPPG